MQICNPCLTFAVVNRYDTMYKTHIQQRNEDFAATCRRILSSPEGEAIGTDVDALVMKALASAPLHYYVSRERAFEVYRVHSRGGRVREGLWTEFCADVDAVLALRPWLGELKAVDFVAAYKRPSRFHFSLATGRRIISPCLGRALKFRNNLYL